MKHTYSTSDLGCLKFNKRREAIGWNIVERNWKELKGTLKETWCDMTDDELDVIAGKREQLVGKIQTKYEVAREEAEKQVNAFVQNCDNRRKKPTGRLYFGARQKNEFVLGNDNRTIMQK